MSSRFARSSTRAQARSLPAVCVRVLDRDQSYQVSAMGTIPEPPKPAPYVQVHTPRARQPSQAAPSEISSIDAEATGEFPHVPTPLDTASLFSQLTLGWVTPLVRLAFKAPLTERQVWSLPDADTAGVLERVFDYYYSRAQQTHNRSALARALWHSTRTIMLVALVLQLGTAGLTILQPLLIKSILLYLQGQDNMFGITNGYVLAVLLSLVTVGSVTTFGTGMYFALRAGVRARLIVMNSVYQKLLRLTASARHSLNSGDLITLANVEGERVFEAYCVALWFVLSPLILLLVCIFIGIEMGGYVALAAAASSIAILTYATFTARTIGAYRRQISRIAGERVKVTNEVLQGVRVVKMYAWENAVAERVAELRAQEIALLKKYDHLRVANMVTLFLAQTLMATVCLFVYVFCLGKSLTVPTTFTLLAFLNICRMPFSIFSNAVIFLSEAWASIDRLAKFLTLDEDESMQHSTPLLSPSAGSEGSSATVSNPMERGNVFEIVDAEFAWTKPTPGAPDNSSFRLGKLNLTIPRGSLIMVVGPVGSGKTSLVNALMGEMHLCDGTFQADATIAYASQQPWIQHRSVRDNILFGDELDRDWYARVVAACQLERDLMLMEHGDASDCGERGSNLSGGQKARVSLARAMYKCKQRGNAVMLWDDPLSALDVAVATALFESCVLTIGKDQTRVLVLNSHYHLLKHADEILVMGNGQIEAQGSYDAIKHLLDLSDDRASTLKEDELAADEDDSITTGDEQTDSSSEESEQEKFSVVSSKLRRRRARQAKKLTTGQEDRSAGSIGWSTYAHFLSCAGWNGNVLAVVLLLFFALGQAVLLGSDYFLSYWSKGSMSSWLSQQQQLWVYMGLVVVSLILCYGRSVFYTNVCVQCSDALHATCFNRVLHASVTNFFDRTPLGRILTRFSHDLDQMDNPFPYYSMWFLVYGMLLVAVFTVCAVTSPYTLILYVPLLAACYRIQVMAQSAARDLKRLDGISRAPFLNLINETMNGHASIRAYHMSPEFVRKCHALLNWNSKFYFMFQTTCRWLSMRLDWLTASVVMVVAFLCVITRESIGPASAGIALTYAIQLSNQFQRLMTVASTTENIMTSFERIVQYEDLPSEDANKSKNIDLNDDDDATDTVTEPSEMTWPSAGAITFDNVSVSYGTDEGAHLVLRNVSFHVHGGFKVGICGRTGSGKSTLMNALFRLVGCAGGRILVDGVDIATVGLRQLRSKLTIIPQEPVLFSGSLRMNLDPFGEKTDDELWSVHLWDACNLYLLWDILIA
ncbi:TPA: hypothetical protein N0F65_001656 [Lagenidium giganteum]|uniref:Uncharacterized protein n=1 Tax=Lagenidium giganteum TaxID=4803 RepID=A0AAV2Z1W9_9STRA|nr:TPA: hypothetical protein N0F65_001656 [Lagenidium giganteum]